MKKNRSFSFSEKKKIKKSEPDRVRMIYEKKPHLHKGVVTIVSLYGKE